MIFSAIPVFKLIKNNQFGQLSLNVKITFISMMVYAVYTFVTKVWIQVNSSWFSYLFTAKGRIKFSLTIMLFLLIHWQFTTHYLQAASLLKPTINAHGSGDLSEVKRRKRFLTMLETAVYVVFVVFFAVMCFYLNNDYWLITWLIVWLGFSCVLTAITFLSMRHINLNSRSLQAIGIETNKTVMRMYLTSLFLFTINSGA